MNVGSTITGALDRLADNLGHTLPGLSFGLNIFGFGSSAQKPEQAAQPGDIQ